MNEDVMDFLPARWVIEARNRVPDGGKAEWWPFLNGGIGNRCTCGWGGESAYGKIPDQCMCGAKFVRATEINVDVEVRDADFVIEGREKARKREEEKKRMMADYDRLPWYAKLFKRRPE